MTGLLLDSCLAFSVLVAGSMEGSSFTYSQSVESRRSGIQVKMISGIWILVPTGQRKGQGVGEGLQPVE